VFGSVVIESLVVGVLTLAAAVVPAAWAGRRRILAAVADR
jgi:hypothetical protein